MVTWLRWRVWSALGRGIFALSLAYAFLVILMTAYSTIENAVEAMKLGAFHYVNKPFDLDEVVMLVEKALETSQLRREVRALRTSQGREFGFDAIIRCGPFVRSQTRRWRI